MNTASVLKSDRIKGFVLHQIDSGELMGGDAVPSVNQLADMFAVSRNTAAKALSDLTLTGVLEGRQGKGTFVAEPKRNIAPGVDTRRVAVFMPASGHVYDDQRRVILQELQTRDRFGVSVELGHWDIEDHDQCQACLEQVLAEEPEGLIVSGWEAFPYEVLLRHADSLPRTVFVSTYGFDYAIPGVRVLTDYFAGARLATDHLLGLGHRRIALVVPPPPLLPPGRRLVSSMRYPRFIEGYRAALALCPGAHDGLVVEVSAQSEQKACEHLVELLRKPDGPTAILTSQDSWAKVVLNAALAAGRRVPDDLAIVGYYNTPWADAVAVPLTSVSIREDELARLAVRKLLDEEWGPAARTETIPLAPRLVVRESSGGVRTDEANEAPQGATE